MKIIFSFFVFFTLIIYSCSNENINEKLKGNWNIESAFRNGRKTSTLEQAYFKFLQSDSLETNIMGSDIKIPYVIKKNIIISDNNLPEIIVTNIENDSLNFEFSIEQNHFQLTMIKSSNE